MNINEGNGIQGSFKENLDEISAIKSREQMLLRILSTISCGVIQYNRDTNEIVMVNKAALEILGYSSKEELVADNFDGVAATVLPEDREYIHGIVRNLKVTDEVKNYEYRAVHKDGKVVFCYGSVQMFYNDLGEVIVQRNVMDITEKVERSKQIQDLMTMHMQMLNSLSCGILSYTLPERRILILNQEAKRLFNYDGEKSGKSFSESMYEHIITEDATELNKITSKLKKEGDSCKYKFRLIEKGKQLMVECTTKLLAFDDGEKFILSVMQDVTDKEEMQYIIKRERQQYRDAVTAKSIFSFGFDVTEGMICHDIKYREGGSFGQVYNIQFPISYDEFINAWKRIRKPEFLTPSDSNQNNIRELIKHYKKGNTNINCEYYIPQVKKYYRRTFLLSRDDLTGHIMAIVVCNDITDVIREDTRKRNELAIINNSLKKHNEITKSFSSIYFATWEIELDSHNIFEITVPDWAHIVFEKSRGDYEEAVRIIVDNFVADGYREEMASFLNIDTLMKRINEERSLSHEYLALKGGWCSAIFIPSKYDRNGNITNVIYAVRNVDNEKRRELEAKKALEEAYDAASHANAAKTNFLASMSHDIRTPMNAILGMTAIADANIDNKERVKDCLSKIKVSSDHLLGLINEVLDMSKIESGNFELMMEEINLSQLIDSLIVISKPLVEEKNHTLSVNMNNLKHENVIGDSARIKQVFMNLMGNAIKYTPDGGKVGLTVSEKETNNKRVGCYEFIFEDNGIGMSEEFIENIFDPFSRADDSQVKKIQGTGLGMSITRNIVNMMNGNIEIESKLGEGSRFTVTIFLKLSHSSDKAEEILEEKRQREIAISDFAEKDYSGKRILLVEDNNLNAEIAMEIIGMTGIEIEHVNNGLKAVEKIRQAEDGYYNIILMDLQMPIMNGHEATRKIRSLPGSYAKEVPIIAMTANAFAEDVQESKNAGMNEHIAKPLDLLQLYSTLDKWI